MHKTKMTLSFAAIATLAMGCGREADGAVDDTMSQTSCSVEEDDDGNATIECPDGSSVTIQQGEDGIDGRDGDDGGSGKSGKAGEEGEDGAPGTDGEDGAAGKDGKAGEEGAPGEDGEDGAPGEQGEPGLDGNLGEDGLDGEPGRDGENGASCSVECVDEQTARIFCEDGNEVRYQVDSCKMPPISLLSARGYSGCWILPSDRRLSCWGSDGSWELGNGPHIQNGETANLVDTRGLEHGLDMRWRYVASGADGSCGITLAGEGYCWSRSDDKVGNGGFPSSVPSPMDISSLPPGTTWSMISMGTDRTLSCGLTTNGAAYCWGSDSRGKLGNGPISGTQLSPSAVDISALAPETTWKALDTGNGFACGVTSEGIAYCWGSDSGGKLGNGSVTGNPESPSALDVSGLPPETIWAAISAGYAHACALTVEGEAYCWGNDDNGQLGNGELGATASPSSVDMTPLPQGVTFTQLSAGDEHTCGLASDGSAWCWGNRTSGYLGDGTSEGSAPSPVAVDMSQLPLGTTWKHISVGLASTCGLTAKDEVYCWGNDDNAQLGNGASHSQPQLRPEIPVQAAIGVLSGYPQFSGALESNNPHKEFIVLALDGSEELSVTATSSDETIIPSENITVLGTGRERSLSFEPIASGIATITVVVSSSEEEYSFIVEYGASPQPDDSEGLYYHHISDASAALDVGDDYVLLGNETTNTVFLHRQDASGPPIKAWDFSGYVGTGTTVGIESVARTGDTIVWAFSHANRVSDGLPQTRRRVTFATTITGSGADVELSFAGRYGSGNAAAGLWFDLISWDQADGHGMGANALGFALGAASGVVPTAPSGFNIEGLEFAADGIAAYLGFRAPTVDVGGSQHALIVPVINILDLVDGINEVTGLGQFGSPIFLDLSGRSIREMRRNSSGEYLIVASPPDGAIAGENDTWALYTWAGEGQPAVFNRQLPDPSATGGDWEAIAAIPEVLQSGANVRLVTDSGSTIFYGMGETSSLELGLQKSYSQLFALN